MISYFEGIMQVSIIFIQFKNIIVDCIILNYFE